MLLGLVLLAVNLQSNLERILLYLLLFWESSSMRKVLKKNMSAHRRKNKLTAVVYALSLGCIIFLLTSASLQVLTIKNLSTQADADIFIYASPFVDETSNGGKLQADMFEAVIHNYTDSIKDWAYQSGP